MNSIIIAGNICISTKTERWRERQIVNQKERLPEIKIETQTDKNKDRQKDRQTKS